MNQAPTIALRRNIAVLLTLGLIGAGALAGYLIPRHAAPVSGQPAEPPARAQPAADLETTDSSGPLADIALTLSEDAIDRAGIVVGSVRVTATRVQVRVPALVEPNAYRSVSVTPIVPGRVTTVSAELGDHVRRGQALAQVYSPELADAQSRYLAARAELDAHERELRRTERLVEIGADSRQELERVHAEHTGATTLVQSHRSRLALLGMSAAEMDTLSSAADISASASIPAPMDGVVTARQANVGLNVNPETSLFTVVDLTTVWLVGDLYERDFSRVQVGSHAVATTPAYPGVVTEGRVSYIDPTVNPQTRTARVRVEVPNPNARLRLGMYAEMQLGDERPDERLVVPRSAVQILGNRNVVYLADSGQAGRFIEREVQLGATLGEDVEVTSGVKAGDRIAVKGTFSLRAERERLGLR